MNKKTIGVALSYLLIVIDIVVGILFVPFLLKSLGDAEYGIYKLMLSTASYLSVLDFGLGGTITRYVVKFKTQKNRRDEENFLAMGFLIYGILALLVLLLATGIAFVIPKMYAASIMPQQFGYAQLMFMLICSHTAVALFNHAFNGLLLAYEKYTYQKLVSIVKILIRVTLLVALISSVKLSIVIAVVDLALTVLLVTVNYFYCTKKLKCKIKLHGWDWPLAKEAGVFTTAILLQSIINQFNSNVNNVVLGIFTTTATVALYSIALQLFTMYSNLSTAVSSIYLPSISKAVFRGDTDDQITERVIEPSRIQLVVLLLALSGFLLFGKDFITLWVGKEYLSAFTIGVILLVSSTLELSQNTITSVLKAKNILHGKTLILLISTVANAVLTVLLVPRLGAVGAAIGTAFSMIFGYGVALNIYYQKRAKLNMKLYYKKTYSGILPAAVIAAVIGIGIDRLIVCNGYLTFVLKAAIYVCVYLAAMLLIGLNTQEKAMCKKFLRLSNKH